MLNVSTQYYYPCVKVLFLSIGEFSVLICMAGQNVH